MLQSGQAGAAGSAEGTEVAHFHEVAWQNVLEEALDEMLHREGAGFELAGIGRAVLESNLGGLHAALMLDGDQAPVAKCHAVDVGSQVFERGLSVADWFTMHDPFSPPDFFGDVCVESRSL